MGSVHPCLLVPCRYGDTDNLEILDLSYHKGRVLCVSVEQSDTKLLYSLRDLCASVVKWLFQWTYETN